MPTALCYPNRFDSASLSGVGWSTGLPLSNLSTRQISQVARSIALAASFYAAHSAAKEAGVIAAVGHNLTTDGEWRVRGFSGDPRPTYEANFTQGQLPSGWTSTRGSAGTYFGADGLLKTAGPTELRITHDPVTRACLGLLAEAAATNALTYARDGTNAAWSKTFMGTPTLSAVGIDGVANTATRLSASGGNAKCSHTHSVGGTPYVFSVWLRRVSGTGVVRITADNYATTATCALTTTWQRFEISSSSGAGVVGIQIDTSGDVIEFDYAQCELGSVATSPILTTSSTATRNNESAAYASSLGAATATAGALVLTGQLLRRPTGSATICGVSFGTPGAFVVAESTGNLTGQYANSGTQCSISTGALANGQAFGCALSWAANDYRFGVNGSQGTADTSGTVGASAAASISISGASQLACIIKTVKLYAAAKADADLNSLASATDSEHVAAYDSGWVDAWQAEWVADTDAEQRDGVRGLSILTPAAAQTFQHWRFDLRDSTNPAGYLELGRVFMGTKWTPDYGAVSGATLGYRDRSSFIEAYDGARYFIEARCPKVARFNLEGQTREAVMRKVLDMQRRQGTTREVLIMLDDADLTYRLETSFLGTLKQLAPPTALSANLWSAPFELEELL